MQDKFQIVGIQEAIKEIPVAKKKWYRGKPVAAMVILGLIVAGCLCCGWIGTKDPGYMDLGNSNVAPNREFLFGTDTMGRDIFSMIWYGGRISLFIGFMATAIATLIAVVFGALSGYSKPWIDNLLMRAAEILLSIPNLLLVVLIQAWLGKANVVSIAVVIGVTSWMSMAKVIRTEVRQIHNSDYVIAAKCMGAGFWQILWRHLTPNFISSIQFMIVMNVRSAMIAESTLSFMGIGLPIETVSWGSMLSLADKALLSDSWWMIWIPGGVLVVTLVCMTSIGEWWRRKKEKGESNW